MRQHTATDINSLQVKADSQSTEDLLTRNLWEPYFRLLLIVTGIWRNWYWITPLSIILAGATAVGIYFHTKLIYTSSSWVRFASARPYSIFNDQMSLDAYQAFVRTNLALLNNKEVVDLAFQEIALRAKEERIPMKELIPTENYEQWLRYNMSVSPLQNSEIYLISFTTINPKGSAILANAITTSYLRYIKDHDNLDRGRFFERIKSDIEHFKGNVETLKDDLSRLIKLIAENGGTFQPEIVSSNIQTDPLLMEKIRAESILEVLKKEKEYNEEILKPDKTIELSDSEVEFFVFNDPGMLELLREQSLCRVRLESLKEKYEPDYILLKDTEKEYESIQKDIDKLREELLEIEKKKWVQEMKTKAKQESLHLEEAIDSQEIRINHLKGQYNDRIEAMSTGGQDNLRATFKQAEILREESVTNLLMDRLNQLKVDENAPGRITLVQPASVSGYPENGTARLRLAMMAGIIAFCVPFGLGWIREMLSESYYHPHQFKIYYPHSSVRYLTGMPNPGLSLHVSRRNQKHFQQNIEEICNEICRGKYFTNSKIVMFSSVAKDDNQVLLTTNVAKTMAQMLRQNVLLINANFRSDRFERILQIGDDVPGLADVLSLKCPLSDGLINDKDIPNLYYLHGQDIEISPALVFGNENLELMLQELKKHYAMIIVSAPPLYTSSESYVLAALADSLILCIRLNDTRRSQLQQVIKKLRNIDVSPGGFLVS
jgi:Mrp family chromosome partitioning ATPase